MKREGPLDAGSALHPSLSADAHISTHAANSSGKALEPSVHRSNQKAVKFTPQVPQSPTASGISFRGILDADLCISIPVRLLFGRNLEESRGVSTHDTKNEKSLRSKASWQTF